MGYDPRKSISRHIFTYAGLIIRLIIRYKNRNCKKYCGAVFSAWNIIALRDTVCDMLYLFLSNEGVLVAKINDIHVYLQRLHGITICVIFEYAMPLAGAKPWERVQTVTANVYSLRVQNWNCFCPCGRLELRMRIQNVALKIHFPVPKRLCKQGTKNVFNMLCIPIDYWRE